MAVCALQRTRAESHAQPVAAQHKPSMLCCALQGCARIRRKILKIRCDCAEKRAATLFSETCFNACSLCARLTAVFGRLAGNCNCQRAARAQLRRDQTQPLAQWRLAARTRPQNCRCPRLFGPLQARLHAVWTQLCLTACHEYRFDVSAGVWQHHQID